MQLELASALTKFIYKCQLAFDSLKVDGFDHQIFVAILSNEKPLIEIHCMERFASRYGDFCKRYFSIVIQSLNIDLQNCNVENFDSKLIDLCYANGSMKTKSDMNTKT